MAGAAVAIGAGISAEIGAHPSDAPFAEWFMSLKQPDNPVASCCGPSDQFYATEYHEDPDHPGGYVVAVEGFALPARVPPEKVNRNDVNPTGRGVIFMVRSWETGEMTPGRVYCFVPGVGT